MVERLRPGLATWGVAAALAVMVLALRLIGLDELAPVFASDEGENGLFALSVLDGRHALVFGGHREPLGIYANALAIRFLGRTVLAVRLAPALASTGTVLVIWWLGRLLFGQEESGRVTRWRGLMVGGVAAGLTAVSLSQTVVGRTGYRANFLPLLLCLCLALLWWGWTRRRWWGIGLAGLCGGLLPYTYSPARFTPFLLVLFGLSMLPLGAGAGERIRKEWRWVALFVGLATLVAVPIMVYFGLHPEHFWSGRIRDLFIFGAGETGSTLAANLWADLAALSFRGLEGCCDTHGQPVLSPWEALFFWLGAGMAAWQWRRRPACRLLLIWAGVMLLPAFLSREISTIQMIGAVPAIYLLAAAGVWEAYRRAVSIMAADRRWQLGLAAVIGALIVVQGISTYRAYRGWMADSYRYDMIWPGFAQILNGRAEKRTVYLIPHVHLGFTYLYGGESPVRMFYPYFPELGEQIGTLLADLGEGTTVKVVDWDDGFKWPGYRDVDYVSFLFNRYGRHVGRETYEGIEVDSYVDVTLNRPWTFYEELEPPTVEYDRGIRLQGVALGKDGEVELAEDRPLLLILQWQVEPGLDVDYAVSLRLHGNGGEIVYQADDLLWNPRIHVRTSEWPAGEAVDTVFVVEAPDGLAAGEYGLRMVVYDSETLVPTVEVGVWEPEVLLARVQVR